MEQNLGLQFGVVGENSLPLTDLFNESICAELPKGSNVLYAHYTDYGGSFISKVLIAYFEESYPDNIVTSNLSYNGKEAVIFGDVVEELRECDKRKYLAGFEGLEEFMLEYMDNMIAEECDRIIEERFSDRSEVERRGIYIALSDYFHENAGFVTFGLDYSESGLEEYIKENLPTDAKYVFR